MGTAYESDAWTVGQAKPLTQPEMRAVGAEPGEGLAGLASDSGSASSSTEGQGTTTAAELAAWLEAAFGPAIAGFGRELRTAAHRLTQPMKLENPWLWIGAAGLVGYALGRTRILRPLVTFGVRTALTTFVERAMRTG